MFANATAEQLARIDEILQQLDELQRANPDANRRRAKRVVIRAAMTGMVLAEGADAPMKIFSRNISTSGIGFVSRRLCKAGERLALSFELPGRSRKLVLARVTFCRYIRAGVYDAGAEFIECVVAKGDKDRIPAHWARSSTLRDGGKMTTVPLRTGQN